MGYELLPHTADVMLSAWGPTTEDCLAEAARALVACVADVREARPAPAGRVHLRPGPGAGAAGAAAGGGHLPDRHRGRGAGRGRGGAHRRRAAWWGSSGSCRSPRCRWWGRRRRRSPGTGCAGSATATGSAARSCRHLSGAARRRQPFTTPTGTSRATGSARPATSAGAYHLVHVLVRRRRLLGQPARGGARAPCPAPASSRRTAAAGACLTAAWRLSTRPAPWQALWKAGRREPARTYEAVPMEPGTSTGWPTGAQRSGRSGDRAGTPGWRPCGARTAAGSLRRPGAARSSRGCATRRRAGRRSPRPASAKPPGGVGRAGAGWPGRSWRRPPSPPGSAGPRRTRPGRRRAAGPAPGCRAGPSPRSITPYVVGADLVSQSSRAGVDHHADQARPQPQRLGGALVVDPVDRLHLQEVVARAEAAELAPAALQRPLADPRRVGIGAPRPGPRRGPGPPVRRTRARRRRAPPAQHPVSSAGSARGARRRGPCRAGSAGPAGPSAAAAAGRSAAGCRSAVSSRTPQEMSKPTPPGETTPAAGESVAATPPIGKPYPQCTSGIAYDGLDDAGQGGRRGHLPPATGPHGRRAAASSVAKTTPGTRIAPCGSIRHRHGPSGITVTMPVTFPLASAHACRKWPTSAAGSALTGTELTRSYERGRPGVHSRLQSGCHGFIDYRRRAGGAVDRRSRPPHRHPD